MTEAESDQRPGFFRELRLDDQLPQANAVFWSALLAHIQAEVRFTPQAILDVGCHSGGLLEKLCHVFHPKEVFGLEPSAGLRGHAQHRLQSYKGALILSDQALWEDIAPHTVDLLTSHEVLYLEPDLTAFMRRVRRVLAPEGLGFIVLGSHADNPLWSSWKPKIEAAGHRVFSHRPFDILSAAAEAGLSGEVQPLRRSGWIRYSPNEAPFQYPDVATMFDHHYRQKLIFRLQPL